MRATLWSYRVITDWPPPASWQMYSFPVPVRVRLLGPLALQGVTGSVPLGGPTERAVLAMLALDVERAVSESALLDGLWGDAPPASALKTLRTYVSRLRSRLRAVGDDHCRIETRPGGYSLRLGDGVVDVHEVEELFARARAAVEEKSLAAASSLFDQAVESWDGEPLADLLDFPFAARAAVPMRELHVSVLADRLDLELALGRHVEAVPELEALCIAHPDRERVWSQLMLALYRAGRQRDALQAFQRLRTYLVAEHGIEPGPTCRELDQRILNQDPALDWSDEVAWPTGVVTFVFTDIVGSTRLFRRLGDGYLPLLEAHNRLLREAFKAHGGIEVKTEGDAFMVAFAEPSAALEACADGQRALARHPWSADAEVHVRMGVHTGPAVPVGKDYIALAVHQAARISAAAHGDQVLVSEETARVAERTGLDGLTLEEVGRYQLRDFPAPEQLYQVCAPDLPSAFPRPRALSVLAHNLPFLRTSFVGRDEAVEEIGGLLDRASLVTIVGPGGVGKTRLSIEVAFRNLDRFRNGVWMIELASVTDPGLVGATIARTLGIPEAPGRPIGDVLADALRPQQLLLVVDNCEQVIDEVASVLEGLLRCCPELVVLTTSREPINIDGEAMWRLTPLSTPDLGRPLTPTALAAFDSVRLFIDRAALTDPSFELSAQSCVDVAEIVARLDGIPLAIEIAVAALRDLELGAIRAGLAERFEALPPGRRTAPARHRTLHGVVQWSFDLLSTQEQLLFARLSTLAGGWTLDGAIAVCADERLAPENIPQAVDRLHGASLVSPHVALEGRFGMLETVREFATVKLSELDDDAIHARHLHWFRQAAERGEDALSGPGRGSLMVALEADLENFRRAIQHALHVGPLEEGLRIGAALAPFWIAHGNWTEANVLLTQLIDRADDDSPVLAKALLGAANLLLQLGDYDRGEQLFDRARLLAESADDPSTLARSLSGLGYVEFRRSRLEDAEVLWRRALEAGRRAGDKRVTTMVLRSMAITAAASRDQARCAELLDEAIASARDIGDEQQLRLLLGSAAEMNLWRARYDLARSQYGDALRLAQDIGDHSGRASLLADLASVEMLQARYEDAQRCAAEAVELATAVDSGRVQAQALCVLGEVAACQGRYPHAHDLFDKALAVALRLGAPAEIASVKCAQASLALEELRFGDSKTLVEEVAALKPLEHGMRRVGWRWLLGEVARCTGDLLTARHEFETEFEVVATPSEARRFLALDLRSLADVASAEGDVATSIRLHREALGLRVEIEDRLGTANSMEGLAAALARGGQGEEAAKLVAAANTVRTELGAPRTPREERELRRGTCDTDACPSVDSAALEESLSVVDAWSLAASASLSPT